MSRFESASRSSAALFAERSGVLRPDDLRLAAPLFAAAERLAAEARLVAAPFFAAADLVAALLLLEAVDFLP